MDAHQVKHKYLVIADEDTVLGFRCAGVPGIAAGSADAALAALQVAREEKAGMVIITEEVAAMIQAEVDKLRLGGTLPMVVEIPGARGPLPGRRGLGDMIRQAIGVRM